VRFGTRAGFDKQHRRVSQRVGRFRFTAWVAEQLGDWERERLEQTILGHLQDAIDAWADAWGRSEFQRIGTRTLAELDQETRQGVASLLGSARVEALSDSRVSELPSQDASAVRGYLGERVLFNVQRQLMLEITGSLWVEYLTSIDLLRQGIGLQSYAQKDPLAEYKVRAYEMFQSLLESIQSQIVTAMFTYRPRDSAQVRVGGDRKKPRSPSGAAKTSTDRSRRRKRRKRKR
jgi:preprotein translocase subunit SecA